MEQRINVVTLGLADLERSRQFYENGLRFLRGNSSEEIVFFQLNGVILALFPRDHLAGDALVSSEGNGFRGLTLAHCTHSRESQHPVIGHLRVDDFRIVEAITLDDFGFLVCTGTLGMPEQRDGRRSRHFLDEAADPVLQIDIAVEVKADVVLRKQDVRVQVVPARRRARISLSAKQRAMQPWLRGRRIGRAGDCYVFDAFLRHHGRKNAVIIVDNQCGQPASGSPMYTT